MADAPVPAPRLGDGRRRPPRALRRTAAPRRALHCGPAAHREATHGPPTARPSALPPLHQLARPGRAVIARGLRTLGRALLVALVGLSLVVGSFVLVMRGRARTLGERLLTRVPEVQAVPARTTHVAPPLPGAVGDSLGPALVALRPARDAVKQEKADTLKLRRAVADGERPLAELPEPWRGLLVSAREPMLQAVRASRAASPALPPGLRPFALREVPLADDGVGLALLAGKLAALSLRAQLDQGEVAPALELCTDALGLARDLGWGRSLLSRMVSVALQGQLVRPCAAALDRASPAQLATARAQVRSIRENTVPLASVVLGDWVAGQVEAFGNLTPDDVVAKLPPIARSPNAQAGALDFAYRAVARHAWWLESEQFDQLEAAVKADPKALRPAVKAMQTALSQSKNPIAAIATPDWTRYLDRAEDALDGLALLEAAAVARERRTAGAWPTALAEALPPGADPARFALAVEGEGLALSFKPRSPLEGQPPELKLVLHP